MPQNNNLLIRDYDKFKIIETINTIYHQDWVGLDVNSIGFVCNIDAFNRSRFYFVFQ